MCKQAGLRVLVFMFCLVVSAWGETSYQASWDSLDARPTPQWFADAKFGIFIHWGVYSVPAWGPKGRYAEWYWHDMQNKKGETWKHHLAVYGEKFKYQDFAPEFKAELFDPDHWADIFVRSGARYVVLTSKHHEGFCLWPSEQSWNWNSVDIGPHRDLCGDLIRAVRARGLKMGYYYSLYEWYNPIYHLDMETYVTKHMIPQLKDLVLRYKPDIIWADGDWEHPDSDWQSRQFLAWLFNESPVKDTVAVNDRWGKGCRCKHGGYYTTEYGHRGDSVDASHPWEECRGIGASFGYNRNETIDEYSTRTDLIRLLVKMVSHGGNLLLDIGPTADGRIPVIMEDRLIAMGNWLKVYGESIYGTHAGPFQKLEWGASTQKGKRIYLHIFQWPKNGILMVPLPGSQVKAVSFLAPAVSGNAVSFEKKENSLQLNLSGQAPDAADTVLALDLE